MSRKREEKETEDGKGDGRERSGRMYGGQRRGERRVKVK